MSTKIFLHYERGMTSSDWFRSYHTFNFGHFQHPYKQATSDLYVWNDETLAAKHTIQIVVEQPSFLILLPLVGTLTTNFANNSTCIEPGAIWTTHCQPNDTISLSNQYENELISYLQIWILMPVVDEHYHLPSLTHFQLDEHKNTLLNNQLHAAINLHVGKFAGRH